MRVGTKSILFGGHQFLLHPLCVAWGWTLLYGFPKQIQLWFAFFLHDIGYFSRRDMDGDEGRRHPERGAAIMTRLFGEKWGKFTLAHSRYYAKTIGITPSKLCYADKMATVLMPFWLYVLLVSLSGEVHEYMTLAESANLYTGKSRVVWARTLRNHWREEYAHLGSVKVVDKQSSL